MSDFDETRGGKYSIADQVARFANATLQHRCAQIAMDGSEKIAQRWLPTLQRADAPLLRAALSAWVHYVLYTDVALEDPQAQRLLELRQRDQDRLNLDEGNLRLAFQGLRFFLFDLCASGPRQGHKTAVASEKAARAHHE